MSDLRIPKIVIPTEAPERTVTVGIPAITFDGQPFPFTTTGSWRLEFGKDNVAELSLTMPVLIVAPEPAP